MDRMKREMKRREMPRYSISGTQIILKERKNGQSIKGNTEDMCEKGILLSFPPLTNNINRFLFQEKCIKVRNNDKEVLGEIKWWRKDDGKDKIKLGISLDEDIGALDISIPPPISINKQKVRFTKDKSLFNYLHDLLLVADQFICSDIAFIGYVISLPSPGGKKVIALSDTVWIGEKGKELKNEAEKHKSVREDTATGLKYLETNPADETKRTCMARSYRNYIETEKKEPILIRYCDDDECEIMTDEEKGYKRNGWFARIAESITAELTIPIVVDVDKEVRILMNFETTQKGAPTFNCSTKERLRSFAEAVSMEFKETIFKTPKSFRDLLYHAAIHHIMGEYIQAAREFETWRKVQCQDIFRDYPLLEKVLFSGFKGFYQQLTRNYQSKGSPSQINEDWNNLLSEGLKGLFRESTNTEKEKNSLENNLEYGFPLYTLLEVCEGIHHFSGVPEERRWRNKAENIYQLILEKRRKKDPKTTFYELPELTGLFDIIWSSWYADKKANFYDWRHENFKRFNERSFGEEDFFEFYLHLRFLIGITELTSIQEGWKDIQKESGEHPSLTFEEFKVVKKEDRVRLLDFIITCSTLILWEDIRIEDIRRKKTDKTKKLSIPMILAYIYRGDAYLLLDEKRKAYNDLTHLEHLIETYPVDERYKWLPAILDESIEERAKHFIDWVKILLKYQKGKVYFASFAHRMALKEFCGMMERYEEFSKRFSDRIPFQYTIVEAMIYKGKLFLDTGSFQCSLKWFLKALREVLRAGEKEALKPFWPSPLSEQLLSQLINKLEEFKHDAIIKKDELIDKLFISKEVMDDDVFRQEENSSSKGDLTSWEDYYKDTKMGERLLLTDCLFGNLKEKEGAIPNVRLLSDLCNRIGFVIFLINLYDGSEVIDRRVKLADEGREERIEIAGEWIEWAIYFDRNNGFARLNRLLLKFARGTLTPYPDMDKDFCASLRQERFYRRLYPLILKSISERYPKPPTDPLKRVAYDFMRYLLTYVDEMIKKPAEIFSYLTRKGWIKRSEKVDGLYFLERWSSWSPKLPRPRVFSVRGGGKLLVWKGKGIAIDPGFDFLTNLYEEGFSLEDIGAICITHDHLDHTDDFDSICRLIKEYNEVVEEKKRLILLVNPGFSQKCQHYLQETEEVEHMYVLNHDSRIELDDFHLSIDVLRASHSEQNTERYAVGFVVTLKDNDSSIKIGFTGDTRYDEGDPKLTEGFKKLESCDIVIAHLSHATFRELKGILELDLQSVEGENFEKFREWLTRAENGFEGQNHSTLSTILILKWALWYGREGIADLLKKEPIDDQIPGRGNKGKGVLGAHLGIYGVNKVRGLMGNSDKTKLLILSEFREELGSFRYKLAQLLNKYFDKNKVYCCTADIGMAIGFDKGEIKMQCSFCKQDNDLNIGTTPYHPFTFHPYGEVGEVCVKGENEGIFYFCKHHMPGPCGQFLERVDHFSLFRVEEI